MRKTSNFLFILILTGSLLSCVSQKKYKAATAENTSLHEQNANLQRQLTELNSKQQDLMDKNQALTTNFNSYRSQCEAMAKRMKEYHASVMEDYKTLMELENVINNAVANFAGHGLEVSEKNGRVYVDMEDNLLFKSGSSSLGENGKKALGALAGALNNYPDLQVIVVGHTDTVKFKDSNFDNLRLSTDRANSVVRTLVGNYKVNPARLISAGQGKYAPVADNSTAEGRAKNRRTEIILLPNFERMWEYLKNNPQDATSTN